MKEFLIYVVKAGEKAGPFTHEQIQAMLASSEVSLGDSAWASGHDSWKPLHVILGVSPPEPTAKTTADHSASTTKPEPAYFYISTARLIFMTIISLGVFSSYWVYKNWRYIKERDGLDISPFWRGWFALFNFHSLLKYIKEDPKLGQRARPAYSSGWLTFGFIAFTLCGNQLVLPSMLTFMFILPAHNHIFSINQASANPPDFSPWSFGQVFCGFFAPVLIFIIIAGSR